MVTTSAKVVIVIGVIVMSLGLFFAMSSLVALFMVFAGIVTIIQGARMQPLAVTSGANTQATRDYYNNPNSHYSTDLSDTWKIKKDDKSKGAI
jgi:hypothetical protein